MMRVLVVLLVPLVVTGCAVGDLALVQQGRPNCCIVLDDQPSRAAREAAAELQSHIRQMSGAQVPVVSGSGAPAGVRILLGESALTAQLGLSADALAPEQVLLRVIGDNLVVMGSDAKPSGRPLRGTLWATYVLLEQVLGVRWLWPGELGTVIPHRQTVTVPGDLDISHTPTLAQRGIRNIGYSDRVQRGLDELRFSRQQFEAFQADNAAWFDRQRIGGSFEGRYGHAYGDYWARYGAAHPAWFALQPDGSRDQSLSPQRARLCVSNQSLIEHIAREKIAELKARPDLECVSISPNDGGPLTFCTCLNCEAWDNSHGPMVEIWWPDGGRKQHVALSDRYVKFYSAVARLVAQQCPDRYLSGYAYGPYRRAPAPTSARLAPNIIIGFVGLGYVNRQRYEDDLNDWEGWSRQAARMIWRPNLLDNGTGFPVNYASRLGHDVTRLTATGLKVTDFDCCYHHWALQGLSYYVLAQMLWNPQAEPDEIIADYCTAGWGPAAAQVAQYFEALERLTEAAHESSSYVGWKDSSAELAAFYTDSFLDECAGYLQAARSKAGSDATILARIDFLQTGLDYTRLNRDCVLARATGRTGDATARERAKAAEQARRRFYQQLGFSKAVNSPLMKVFGF